MKLKVSLILSVLCCLAGLTNAQASERYFAYTYEPETMPQGAWEFENWVTFNGPRNDAVGQHDYKRWEFRQELEYGVTDNYTLSVYLNEQHESFRDTATEEKESEGEFEGVSLENKFMVWNPATHAVGLSLYIEPRFAAHETELEEKIILGQRIGENWKWAFNVSHATEWKDGEEGEDDETEGELEFNFGLTRELNKNWNIGFEFRNHNELPEYDKWEHTAFFLGPVVTFRQENWWATVTAMAQVYGKNYNDGGDPDGESNLVLDEHELLSVRCIIGVSF